MGMHGRRVAAAAGLVLAVGALTGPARKALSLIKGEGAPKEKE